MELQSGAALHWTEAEAAAAAAEVQDMAACAASPPQGCSIPLQDTVPPTAAGGRKSAAQLFSASLS